MAADERDCPQVGQPLPNLSSLFRAQLGFRFRGNGSLRQHRVLPAADVIQVGALLRVAQGAQKWLLLLLNQQLPLLMQHMTI